MPNTITSVSSLSSPILSPGKPISSLITARDCKSSRQPQVPSLLEDEYTYNPFFRVKSPELRRNALLHASTNAWFDLREMRLEIGLPGDRIGDDNEETDVIVLGIVRTMKNQFKAP